MVNEWKNPYYRKHFKLFHDYKIYWESDMDKATKLAVELAAEIEANQKEKTDSG